MTYSEKLAFIGDLTRAQFAAVTNVTGISPIELVDNHNSAGGPFDFLAPVANHIYYVEKISLIQINAVGAPIAIQAYNISAAALTIVNIGFVVAAHPSVLGPFWCTRLAQLGTTTGFYGVVLNGFDITYT